MAQYEQTLCWECKNTHRDKCSWFNPADPKPVPGWVAELRPKAMIGESYLVKECPNFDPEPPREEPQSPAPAEPVIRGVYRTAYGWCARVFRGRKCYHLGTFPSEEEAIAARLAAEEAIARGEEPQKAQRPQRKAPKPRKVLPPDHCPGVKRQDYGWTAQITSKGKYFYLGTFPSREEAIAARLAAEEAIARGEEPRRKEPKPKAPKAPPVKKKKKPKSRRCAGVYAHRGYWEARISCHGKVIYLGYFKNEADAVAARKAAEKAIKRGETPRSLKER